MYGYICLSVLKENQRGEMNVKEWILLMVPIICNGLVEFVLQKIFEKRQWILSEKYKYL